MSATVEVRDLFSARRRRLVAALKDQSGGSPDVVRADARLMSKLRMG